ncbi:MAG: hypothetical protein SGJ27_21115 [Candidatus Melainabacteria bacterium]|nr:hypothetical protein [Candidatus Melainabacteria bacterium]
MTQAVTEPKPKRYRLKSMVLARMLAEISVLLILFVLPWILMLTGHFQTISLTGKVVLFALCIVSTCILPAYAFVTWRVKTDSNGITTMSLAKQEHCSWSSIKRISRRSNWTWVRYVIEHEGGELSFPIWLAQVEDLIDMIRQRLPKGGPAGNPFRKFSQDRISLLFQCMQAALGVGLVVVFWFFFSELAQHQSTSQSDLGMVFAFCGLITALFIWRTIVVFLMPKSLEITPSGIIIDTMLFSRRISWQNVLKIGPSYPLLPEGFMLETEQGSFLIGNGMDSADELVSSLKGKIESGQSLATARSTTANPFGQNKNSQKDFNPDKNKSISADRSNPQSAVAGDQGGVLDTSSVDQGRKQSVEARHNANAGKGSKGARGASNSMRQDAVPEIANANVNANDGIDEIESSGITSELHLEMRDLISGAEIEDTGNDSSAGKAVDKLKTQPSGKKADRKFRKRKNKNKP